MAVKEWKAHAEHIGPRNFFFEKVFWVQVSLVNVESAKKVGNAF